MVGPAAWPLASAAVRASEECRGLSLPLLLLPVLLSVLVLVVLPLRLLLLAPSAWPTGGSAWASLLLPLASMSPPEPG